MKIEIEVSDFYFEDGEFETEFKKHIINSAVYQIGKNIEEKMKVDIINQIKLLVEQELFKRMQVEAQRLFTEGKLKSNNKNEMVSFEDWMRERFEQGHGWNQIQDHLKQTSEKFAKECRARYDLMFASQVVAKMKDNGFLNDEAAKLLIDKP